MAILNLSRDRCLHQTCDTAARRRIIDGIVSARPASIWATPGRRYTGDPSHLLGNGTFRSGAIVPRSERYAPYGSSTLSASVGARTSGAKRKVSNQGQGDDGAELSITSWPQPRSPELAVSSFDHHVVPV